MSVARISSSTKETEIDERFANDDYIRDYENEFKTNDDDERVCFLFVFHREDFSFSI